MTTSSGKKVSERAAKLQTLVDFYTDLSKSSNPKIDKITEVLDGMEIPWISEAHRKLLNQPVSEQEIDWSIAHLKLEKSPGSDVLTGESIRFLNIRLPLT